MKAQETKTMNRREISILVLGPGVGIAAVRWTSPGKEGPAPGGSK
jgi:hypothetical protein